MNRPIRLAIYSSPTLLPVVRAALQRCCELLGFDAKATGGIVLSVDEALTNIIRHAYDGRDDCPIEIAFTPLNPEGRRGLRIELRDFGRFVPRDQIKSRNLNDVRPGGLGVHIISECMDHVDYAPAQGGGTLLTLVKNLPTKQETSK